MNTHINYVERNEEDKTSDNILVYLHEHEHFLLTRLIYNSCWYPLLFMMLVDNAFDSNTYLICHRQQHNRILKVTTYAHMRYDYLWYIHDLLLSRCYKAAMRITLTHTKKVIQLHWFFWSVCVCMKLCNTIVASEHYPFVSITKYYMGISIFSVLWSQAQKHNFVKK